jgi:hypothetical protein
MKQKHLARDNYGQFSGSFTLHVSLPMPPHAINFFALSSRFLLKHFSAPLACSNQMKFASAKAFS